MTERKVVADPFTVCAECPAAGFLTAAEHARRCYGRVPNKVGAVACGKKQLEGKARDLYPQIFNTGDYNGR